MLDESTPTTDINSSASSEAPAGTPAVTARKRTTKKAAADKAPAAKAQPEKAAAKKAPAKKAAKKSTAKAVDSAPDSAPASAPADTDAPPAKKAAKRAPAKKAAKKTAATADSPASAEKVSDLTPAAGSLLFQAPEPVAPTRTRSRKATSAATTITHDSSEGSDSTTRSDQPERAERGGRSPRAERPARGDAGDSGDDGQSTTGPSDGNDDDGTGEGPRKRRRRGGRGRRGRPEGEGGDGSEGGSDNADSAENTVGADSGEGDGSGDAPAPRGQRARKSTTRSRGGAGGSDTSDGSGSDSGSDDDTDRNDDSGPDDDQDGESSSSRRRRRRRRRSGGDGDAAPGPDDPPNTVVRVRERRPRGGGGGDEITGVRGSTRLEAKKQRRREGREQGRRKQVITEAEFLARRESVERVMVVRQTGGRTQIGVLEDDVLVEHYVSRDANTSMAGNVYLGRVQNVLPSMEAAFVDIGKGRNAVLYAGEVNWDAAGVSGQAKRIENVLKSGEAVLVQVTKDPIGHKGARLTSQISLPGRYLVYVPEGSMTGISRKLPENERTRLKQILKAVLPEGAGVIVRTAAEGASEEELRRDVERLTSQWEAIQAGAAGNASAPVLLHGEPDLTVRVIRDVFNEDFAGLVVSGDDAWETVESYVGQVAPDLTERVSKWTSDGDLFTHYRIDEQLAKALDRKVWLPSGGSLVIDRTEAMTVVDVNTGKFTGSGGNLEETVTKNNIEAAEEIVRQLRLRDVGGIIVIDFIDMVLESNRDLVLRRLLECLGRDRTKHQVAEVTSLGLVQMTRKRVGQGLLEVFSETCEVCHGRGVIVHTDPVEKKSPSEPVSGNGGGAKGSGRQRGGRAKVAEPAPVRSGPSAAEIAARAHAAAMHNAKLAEDADPDGVDLDDHDHDHGPDTHVHDEHTHDEPPLLDVAPEPAVDDEPTPQPEAEPEPEAYTEPDSEIRTETQPEPEPEPEPEPQAVAPRRRRGRVTAPAGPPPSTT
jgi:ribonuclease E